MAFQPYLIEGLARWNLQRSEDSTSTKSNVRSFNISVTHNLNSLSSAIHNEPSLSSFKTPTAYTGELIGMEYLRTQTGDIAGGGEHELDREIDEAFGDFTIDVDDEEEVEENDETVAMPESDDSDLLC